MFSDNAENSMLDSLTMDAVRLHSGDPGADGTGNQLGAGLSAATFDAAAASERVLDADVTVSGLAANQPVSHFSIWTAAGSVFLGSGAIDSGDVVANAAGEYILNAGTSAGLVDPA